MDTKPVAREFYLDSIDEVFAEIFCLFGGGFHVLMEIVPETSLVGASFLPSTAAVHRDEAVDFELCAFECSGVSAEDFEEYVEIPVHTSSALEFFDYVFSQETKIDCHVDFSGNSWMIILNCSR
ncbi:MAG: hypothetical protein OXH82_03535 [Candidatus Dadabacteria bacterium]|nr:hypothetical protein [Candidatus Dadabacteria bacterium]MDE0662984.1 hypothetical protein [Candidatus Dadabacteria bacterium]